MSIAQERCLSGSGFQSVIAAYAQKAMAWSLLSLPSLAEAAAARLGTSRGDHRHVEYHFPARNQI